MERADHHHNEYDVAADPDWPDEETVFNRANEQLDEKLRHIAEAEEQMHRNAGHQAVPGDEVPREG